MANESKKNETIGDGQTLPCRLCRKPWPLAYLWEIGPGLYYCDFCLDQYGGDPPQYVPKSEVVPNG